MLKSESLIQLVNNLTKQEKKEFSLYIYNKQTDILKMKIKSK